MAAALEPRHADELVALRQRQAQEVADTFRQLAPEDVVRKHHAAQARK